MADPAVDIRNMHFHWAGGGMHLEIGKLAIAKGERILLMGPSGSGKSSLIGLLAGILQPQRGRICLLGQDIAAMRAGRRDRFRGRSIGLIFQMFNLIPYLSLVENVVLPTRFGRRSEAGDAGGDRDEAIRLLTALGLGDPDVIDTPVAKLSHGQQQRTAAARALFGRPGLLIADEPTSALDAVSREQFLALLMAEVRAAEATLLVASHDSGIAPHFDRVLYMDDLLGDAKA